MKICPKCNIEVGGDFEKCPLCREPLTGEPTEKHWPSPQALKHRTRIFKKQLKIVILLLLAFVVLNMFVHILPTPAAGVVLFFWVVIGEFTAYQIVKVHKTASGIFTNCSISCVIGMLLSSIWYPIFIAILPIPLMCVTGVNFVITMCRKKGSVMMHFISFFLMGIVSWIFVMVLTQYNVDILWKHCFYVSMITLIGTFIFRGRDLITEFHKRFSI